MLREATCARHRFRIRCLWTVRTISVTLLKKMETGRRLRSAAVVVEDDPILCASISGALDDIGFATVQCASLRDARTAIKDVSPTVIILDLSLDSEFGGELLEELAQRDEAPPLVVCSSFPLAPLVAARYGVACIRKPFELEALLAAVRDAIAHRRRPARTA